MVSPAARRDAHQLPATTWLSSARTSHSSHGVGCVHWSSVMPATTTRVASRAARCCAVMSSVTGSPLHVRELLRHSSIAHAHHVDAPDVAAVPGVGPELHHPIVRGERLLGVEAT